LTGGSESQSEACPRIPIRLRLICCWRHPTPRFAMSSSITVHPEVQEVVTWTISRSDWPPNRDGRRCQVYAAISPDFSTASHGGVTGNLTLKRYNHNRTLAHSVELRATGGAALPLRARLRCSLRDDEGDEWLGESGELTFSSGAAHCVALAGPQKSYFSHGVLRCEITHCSTSDSTAEEARLVEQKNAELRELGDFGALLETLDLADVTLVVGEAEIRAHKCVLSARSPVFAKMFGSGMRETKENTVKIPYVEEEVMEMFVKFVYTLNFENMEHNAEELLILADKYCVPALRLSCEEHLGKSLSDENAAQRLHLAHVHNAGSLKALAAAYIVKHREKVVCTEGWETLRASGEPSFFEAITDVFQKYL